MVTIGSVAQKDLRIFWLAWAESVALGRRVGCKINVVVWMTSASSVRHGRWPRCGYGSTGILPLPGWMALGLAQSLAVTSDHSEGFYERSSFPRFFPSRIVHLGTLDYARAAHSVALLMLEAARYFSAEHVLPPSPSLSPVNLASQAQAPPLSPNICGWSLSLKC